MALGILETISGIFQAAFKTIQTTLRLELMYERLGFFAGHSGAKLFTFPFAALQELRRWRYNFLLPHHSVRRMIFNLVIKTHADFFSSTLTIVGDTLTALQSTVNNGLSQYAGRHV